ncbi:PLP-dependent aminotransferase family protein [Marinomonas sp. C2222]|uniref:PLP-dependent aminotransferase family protein n=1 Tax=Marinomonas sargassi TaxID=2984494 RepID=A0ABT2YQ26_9GAMM|nr:PLP-dependent aminotransferase family protein [Marinomonas sargassi]MCV2401987.1 PLP-dependent aminotransferase family protein [Marinomonas sargassi]
MKHAIASLRFSLEENGAPFYQQLILQIQASIESGELSSGDKLPSSRSLATSLGVSRSTTSRVYDQLIAEGVLVSEAKRGVFVSSLPMVNRKIQKNTQNIPHLEKPKKPASLMFDAGVDVTEFPTKEWASSMRRSWLTPDLALLQGGYPTGYPALKEAIVEYLYRVRGLQCHGEQIIVTAGNRDSLVLLQHALSRIESSQNREPAWWLESPTYPPIREIFSQQSPNYLEVDEEGMCIPQQENKSNAAVVTPNRHYPLGTSLSPQRRQQWLQKLQTESHNWWLIEDDYDNEFIYQGRSEVPLMQAASLYDKARDKVFFVGSFSKVLFRGLRMGFIVVPTRHIEVLKSTQRTLGSSASLPIQPAVADFMLQGSFDRHINRMRRRYRLKRDVLLSLLDEHLEPWFVWKKTRGGMHILIEFKAELLAVLDAAYSNQIAPDTYVAEQLAYQDIRLSTLSSHYSGTAVARYGFVLGFSGTDEATMEKIVTALRAWLKDCEISE